MANLPTNRQGDDLRVDPQREDERTFLALLDENPTLQALLSRVPALGLSSYYLAAGALVQTVWNVQAGRRAQSGIDLLEGVVRPNKRQVTRAVYEQKTERWRACGPHLRILRWDDG